MKDKKKIIISVLIALAVLAVGVLVGVLIGKKANNKPNEIPSESTTTITTTTTIITTTSTESSTEPSTKPTQKDVSLTVVDGVISNTDRNNFKEILGHILWFTFDAKEPPNYIDGYTSKEYELYNYKNYDYKTTDAKKYAYSKLLTGYQTLSETMSEVYNWNDFEIYEVWKNSENDPEFESDPKNLFGDYYCFVEEKYIDIGLKTVFNVQPDHNYILKSKDGEVYAYYYDGYYYFRGDEGGDGAGPEIEINNVKIQSDGKYLIDATYYVSDPDGREKICDLKVTAEMKTVEGKSIWSFYKIEKV